MVHEVHYVVFYTHEKYLVTHVKKTISNTSTAITNKYQLVHDENIGGLLFMFVTGFVLWFIVR
jgi:hypothetical protein